MFPFVIVFHPHGAAAPFDARQYNRAAMKAMLVDLASHQSWADAEHLRAFEAHSQAAEHPIIVWYLKGRPPAG